VSAVNYSEKGMPGVISLKTLYSKNSISSAPLMKLAESILEKVD